MIELRVSSAAEADYAEALKWYAAQSIEAARRFEVEMDHALANIAANPERFPRCDQHHHFFLMRHFPYQVIYRQHSEHWVVIAIAHTSRQPMHWKGR